MCTKLFVASLQDRNLFESGLVQEPCDTAAPFTATPTMHCDPSTRGQLETFFDHRCHSWSHHPEAFQYSNIPTLLLVQGPDHGPLGI